MLFSLDLFPQTTALPNEPGYKGMSLQKAAERDHLHNIMYMKVDTRVLLSPSRGGKRGH